MIRGCVGVDRGVPKVVYDVMHVSCRGGGTPAGSAVRGLAGCSAHSSTSEPARGSVELESKSPKIKVLRVRSLQGYILLFHVKCVVLSIDRKTIRKISVTTLILYEIHRKAFTHAFMVTSRSPSGS